MTGRGGRLAGEGAAASLPAGRSVATLVAKCPLCGRTPQVPHASGKDFESGTTGDTEWSFVRCPECEVIFLSPRPAPSELSRIYPANYYAYDFTAQKTLGYRVKTLLDERAARLYLRYAPAGSRILDVGCGDGRLLRIFAGRGVPPDRLYGVELDGGAVERARAQGFQVERLSVEEISYPDRFFGLAVLQQVLEHVSDPQAVLQKLHAVLVPGGAAVIETPNTASWDHALFRRRYWGGYHIPRHFFLFNRRSLRRLLESCGFEVRDSELLLSPNFWIQSFHHALAERGYPSALLKFLAPHRPSPIALAIFAGLDLAGKILGVTSNMRMIAVRKE